MIPIEFAGSNVVFAKNQHEYLPLPARQFKDPPGSVLSCWSLTFWERVRLLFLGRLWIKTLTFYEPLQPILPTTDRADVIEPEPSITMAKAEA